MPSATCQIARAVSVQRRSPPCSLRLVFWMTAMRAMMPLTSLEMTVCILWQLCASDAIALSADSLPRTYMPHTRALVHALL